MTSFINDSSYEAIYFIELYTMENINISARNNFCYLGVHQDHYFANFGGHRKNAAVRSFSTEA